MIKAKNPTTPGQRGTIEAKPRGLTTREPLKGLTSVRKQRSGRNNQGRITVRHRGGGAKRFYRLVNFALPEGTSAVVEHIEYDPNRSALIARIKDQAGRYHYMLAPAGLKTGQTIESGPTAPLNPGNRLPLSAIPLGTTIHNIELTLGRGGQLARGAGASAQLTAKEETYAHIKLPSGEVRQVDIRAQASIGAVGNEQRQNRKLGKAGRVRRMGIRPTVRGVVMNATDHPHGGGEGKGKGGNDPRSPWGQPTLGYKTRKPKPSDKLIIRSRHKGRRG
jgi:large subunit ribosomal protein L2